MAAPLSADDYLKSFPSPPSKIQGIPTYSALSRLCDDLKQNAALVPCTLGGGSHGYLGMVITAAMYATLAPGDPFTIPPYPGPHPTYANNATTAQISAATRCHQEALRVWREYTNMHSALQTQLTQAIEPVYLRSQKDRHLGFANVSLRELLAYLFQAYGQLTLQRLIKNQAAMNKAWDPSSPFETLIQQIEDGMELADAASQAFTDAQVLTLAYTLVYNTGLYFLECAEWSKRDPADQTWDAFKLFFLQAQQRLRLQQQATAARSGYSGMMVSQENELAEGLASLATAQLQDRQAYCLLANSNTDLSAKLQSALTEIQNLKTLISDKKPTKRKPNNNYCWSHGFRVSENHTSASCKNPKTGHQTTATKDNMMGGSTAGQPS